MAKYETDLNSCIRGIAIYVFFKVMHIYNFKAVYKETVESDVEMRRYDLSKLGKGGYRIKMQAQGKEFIQFSREIFVRFFFRIGKTAQKDQHGGCNTYFAHKIFEIT